MSLSVSVSLFPLLSFSWFSFLYLYTSPLYFLFPTLDATLVVVFNSCFNQDMTSCCNFPEKFWNFLRVHLMNLILWKHETLVRCIILDIGDEAWSRPVCLVLDLFFHTGSRIHPLLAFRKPLSPSPLSLLSQITTTDHTSHHALLSFFPLSHLFSFLTLILSFFSNNPDYFLLSSSLSLPLSIWFSSSTHHCAKGHQG